jgi:hypothetical protein
MGGKAIGRLPGKVIGRILRGKNMKKLWYGIGPIFFPHFFLLIYIFLFLTGDSFDFYHHRMPTCFTLIAHPAEKC